MSVFLEVVEYFFGENSVHETIQKIKEIKPSDEDQYYIILATDQLNAQNLVL